MLLGEIDLDEEDKDPVGYVKVEVEEVERKVEGEEKERRKREGRRGVVLRGEGFVGEEEGGGAI